MVISYFDCGMNKFVGLRWSDLSIWILLVSWDVMSKFLKFFFFSERCGDKKSSKQLELQRWKGFVGERG